MGYSMCIHFFQGEDYDQPDSMFADSSRQQTRRPPLPIPPSESDSQQVIPCTIQ